MHFVTSTPTLLAVYKIADRCRVSSVAHPKPWRSFTSNFCIHHTWNMKALWRVILPVGKINSLSVIVVYHGFTNTGPRTTRKHRQGYTGMRSVTSIWQLLDRYTIHYCVLTSFLQTLNINCDSIIRAEREDERPSARYAVWNSRTCFDKSWSWVHRHRKACCEFYRP